MAQIGSPEPPSRRHLVSQPANSVLTPLGAIESFPFRPPLCRQRGPVAVAPSPVTSVPSLLLAGHSRGPNPELGKHKGRPAAEASRLQGTHEPFYGRCRKSSLQAFFSFTKTKAQKAWSLLISNTRVLDCGLPQQPWVPSGLHWQVCLGRWVLPSGRRPPPEPLPFRPLTGSTGSHPRLLAVRAGRPRWEERELGLSSRPVCCQLRALSLLALRTWTMCASPWGLKSRLGAVRLAARPR